MVVVGWEMISLIFFLQINLYTAIKLKHCKHSFQLYQRAFHLCIHNTTRMISASRTCIKAVSRTVFFWYPVSFDLFTGEVRVCFNRTSTFLSSYFQAFDDLLVVLSLYVQLIRINVPAIFLQLVRINVPAIFFRIMVII